MTNDNCLITVSLINWHRNNCDNTLSEGHRISNYTLSNLLSLSNLYESVIQTDDENLCKLQCVGTEAVSKILHSLKVNKAAGLDKIPARLVRDAEMELAPSLTYLINKSITDGTVPALWKVARVTPLYESEDKLLVENYRSIYVLPVLSKVLERVVHTQMSLFISLKLVIQTSVRI